MIRRLYLLCFAAVTLLLAACNTAHQTSSFSNPDLFNNRTRFLVGDVVSDVTFPLDVDYKYIWPKELQERLVERKINAEPHDPDAVTINAKILSYERGSAWVRWASGNLTGATKLSIVATLVQHGHEVGVVKADQTVQCCGLYSAGAWSYVFENVAERTVFEIEKKMGTDE